MYPEILFWNTQPTLKKRPVKERPDRELFPGHVSGIVQQ